MLSILFGCLLGILMSPVVYRGLYLDKHPENDIFYAHILVLPTVILGSPIFVSEDTQGEIALAVLSYGATANGLALLHAILKRRRE